MLHRFEVRDLAIAGHNPAGLRQALNALRKDGYQLVPLQSLLEGLVARRASARPMVAFTIDDGYFDHAAVAAPLFAEFDCPVTTFVTTGFLDGALWFWWDRIEYVFQATTHSRLSVPLENGHLLYEWHHPGERLSAQRQFTAWCKTLPESAKSSAIDRLAQVAEVELPASPPRRYAPMSWHDLRRCEGMTMTFGPHTVTHPVLSRTSHEQCRFELRESWERLRAEAAHPLSIFCYPNGQPGDFGTREIRILKELGFLGAVSGVAGYAHGAAILNATDGMFQLRRFAYAEGLPQLLGIVSGVERLKQIVRRER